MAGGGRVVRVVVKEEMSEVQEEEGEEDEGMVLSCVKVEIDEDYGEEDREGGEEKKKGSKKRRTMTDDEKIIRRREAQKLRMRKKRAMLKGKNEETDKGIGKNKKEVDEEMRKRIREANKLRMRRKRAMLKGKNEETEEGIGKKKKEIDEETRERRREAQKLTMRRKRALLKGGKEEVDEETKEEKVKQKRRFAYLQKQLEMTEEEKEEIRRKRVFEYQVWKAGLSEEEIERRRLKHEEKWRRMTEEDKRRHCEYVRRWWQRKREMDGEAVRKKYLVDKKKQWERMGEEERERVIKMRRISDRKQKLKRRLGKERMGEEEVKKRLEELDVRLRREWGVGGKRKRGNFKGGPVVEKELEEMEEGIGRREVAEEVVPFLKPVEGQEGKRKWGGDGGGRRSIFSRAAGLVLTEEEKMVKNQIKRLHDKRRRLRNMMQIQDLIQSGMSIEEAYSRSDECQQREKNLMKQRIFAAKRKLRRELEAVGVYGEEEIQQRLKMVEVTYQPERRFREYKPRDGRVVRRELEEIEEMLNNLMERSKFKISSCSSKTTDFSKFRKIEPQKKIKNCESETKPSIVPSSEYGRDEDEDDDDVCFNLSNCMEDNSQLTPPPCSPPRGGGDFGEDDNYNPSQEGSLSGISTSTTAYQPPVPPPQSQTYQQLSSVGYHNYQWWSPPIPPWHHQPQVPLHLPPPPSCPKPRSRSKPTTTSSSEGGGGSKNKRGKPASKPFIPAKRGVHDAICDTCGEAMSKLSVPMHRNIYHNPYFEVATVTCLICKETFSQKIKWWQHFLKSHPDESSKFKKRKTKTGGDEGKWEEGMEGNKKICEICGKSFVNETSFKEHMFFKHGEGPERKIFKCLRCQEEMGNKLSLERHWRRKHPGEEMVGGGKNRCWRCGRDDFLGEREVWGHLKEEHPGSYFCCEWCGTVKYTEMALNAHWSLKKCGKLPKGWREGEGKGVGGVEKWMVGCGRCGKEVQVYNLTRHVKRWHGVEDGREWRCWGKMGEGECGKVCKTRLALVQHLEEKHGMGLEEMRERIGRVVGEGVEKEGGSLKRGNGRGGGRRRKEVDSDSEESSDSADEEVDCKEKWRGRSRRNIKVICEEDLNTEDL